MVLFNIFYFKEHVQNKSDLDVDNQFIILYDENDENFYYYGTRNRENQKKYINYSGKYHYTRLNEFIQFIDILIDGFQQVITTELHQIDIQLYEYEYMNFQYLKKKLSSSTELSAYDTKFESHDNMYNYLQSLVTHEV